MGKPQRYRCQQSQLVVSLGGVQLLTRVQVRQTPIRTLTWEECTPRPKGHKNFFPSVRWVCGRHGDVRTFGHWM